MGLKSIQLIGNVKTLKDKTVFLFMYWAMNVGKAPYILKCNTRWRREMSFTLIRGERANSILWIGTQGTALLKLLRKYTELLVGRLFQIPEVSLYGITSGIWCAVCATIIIGPVFLLTSSAQIRNEWSVHPMPTSPIRLHNLSRDKFVFILFSDINISDRWNIQILSLFLGSLCCKEEQQRVLPARR